MRSYDSSLFNKFTLLDLMFTEGEGDLTFDRSKNRMEALLGDPIIWSKIDEGIFYIQHISNPGAVILVPNPSTVNPLISPNLIGLYEEDFTILMWYHLQEALAQGVLMARESPASGGYIWDYLADGRIRFTTEQPGPILQTSVSSPGDLEPMKWLLLGVTRKRSVVEFYKNGVKLTKTVSASHISPGFDPSLITEIGNRSGGLVNRNCGIQRVRIIARCLSEDDMMTIYRRYKNLMDSK